MAVTDGELCARSEAKNADANLGANPAAPAAP
jgi:hypothetical protein